MYQWSGVGPKSASTGGVGSRQVGQGGAGGQGVCVCELVGPVVVVCFGRRSGKGVLVPACLITLLRDIGGC